MANTPKHYHFVLEGGLLQRGFWIYVWRIYSTEKGKSLYYIGRTGDTSSLNAASPFDRMSGHLGRNKHANALRRNLQSEGVNPDVCRFEFYAYGPIYSEQKKDKDKHRELGDKTGTIEAIIADEIRSIGYNVLGTHPRRHVENEETRSIANVIIKKLREENMLK